MRAVFAIALLVGCQTPDLGVDDPFTCRAQVMCDDIGRVVVRRQTCAPDAETATLELDGWCEPVAVDFCAERGKGERPWCLVWCDPTSSIGEPCL